MAAIFCRLDAGIFFEGGSIFGWRVNSLHSGKSGKLNFARVWLGGHFKVTKFSGIRCRDVE